MNIAAISVEALIEENFLAFVSILHSMKDSSHSHRNLGDTYVHCGNFSVVPHKGDERILPREWRV